MKKLLNLVKKGLEILLQAIIPEDKNIKKLLDLEPHILYELLPKSPIKNKDIFVLFDYQNSIVKKIIHQIKYKNNKKIRAIISSYIHDEIIEIYSEISMMHGDSPIIIPMPMSKKEKSLKGFNQCEEILHDLERLSENKLQTSYNALIKTKETKRQTTLNKIERKMNVKNSMVAISEIVKNKNILLIDDVYTTKSTIEEAKRALREGGARFVVALCIAH